MSWQRKLSSPIRYRRPRRGELRTLADARDYVLRLGKSYSTRQHWQHAAKLMIEAAEHDSSTEAVTRQLTLALLLDGMLDLKAPK